MQKGTCCPLWFVFHQSRSFCNVLKLELASQSLLGPTPASLGQVGGATAFPARHGELELRLLLRNCP